MGQNRFIKLGWLVALALVMRFGIFRGLEAEGSAVRMGSSILILVTGTVWVLRGAAEVIEETTEVLSERTKLAAGVLQSLGTAFPDMVLGVTAALISLKTAATDYLAAVNFAIIAAATTFGSNIYNILHAAWCVWRQNVANKIRGRVMMLPGVKAAGWLRPLAEHDIRPSVNELDTTMDIMVALTLLTGAVALSMVQFGKVGSPTGFAGDLYQLIRPVGMVILAISLAIIYIFRKTKRGESQLEDVAGEERYFKHQPGWVIWLSLLLSGIAILLAAESMVEAISTFCAITGLPYVVAGVLAGLVGCLGEMLVVHNYSINPKGRIGDALVGVGMDNIVTTMGAAIVAIMGGIFLGGSSLIMIFVTILSGNAVLIWQVAKLKNSM